VIASDGGEDRPPACSICSTHAPAGEAGLRPRSQDGLGRPRSRGSVTRTNPRTARSILKGHEHGTAGHPHVLIADIRGYSRYTDEFGAEAAAGLTAQFVDLVTEDVETHGGKVVEIRGDEALAVFASARQAIRCAVALQGRFDEEAALDHDLPLRWGSGSTPARQWRSRMGASAAPL
jgi:class 3 adenylate cyclase